MRRLLYKALLALHPPSFRNAYAGEMLWIFDQVHREQCVPLFADGCVSLARQWACRTNIWTVPTAAACALLQMGGFMWWFVHQ
jgi:hypothetical protein